MLHRDDFDFRIVNEMESELGMKVVFPGDTTDQETLDRVKHFQEIAKANFLSGKCNHCGKQIEGFSLEHFEGLTFENCSEMWKPGRGYVPEFSMMGFEDNEFRSMCGECFTNAKLQQGE